MELVEWVKLLLPSFLAVFAIFVSVNLSLKKDQKQIVWEKKFNSYISIIEALTVLKNDIDRSRQIEKKYSPLQEETQEARTKYTEALWEVSKHEYLGYLIMSDEALKVFKKFNEQVHFSSKEDTYFESLETMSSAITSCLDDIKNIARNELI